MTSVQQRQKEMPQKESESAAMSKQNVAPVPRISIQIFCENESTVDIVNSAIADRRMSKVHASVQTGGIPAALRAYENGPTPNLIMVESNAERNVLLGQLDELANVCDAGTKVIIISDVNDVILYRELVARGVSEYLVLPFDGLTLIEAISNIYTDPDAEPVGEIVTFIGAKGGVGSSVISHNVAWVMSEMFKTDVVLTDFDLPFGTAGLDLNQDPMQGMADALFQPERFDELMMDRLLAKCSEHLSLFASPGTLEREYDVEQASCDVVIDVLRKNVPYTVVDLPHSWTSWTRYVLMQSDEIIVTAAPDLANLRNTKNILDYLRANRPSDSQPYLIINMAGMPKKPEITVGDFAQIVGLEPTMVINYDAEVFGTASNNGQMINEVAQKSQVATQITDLAKTITGSSPVVEKKQKSILSPFLGRLGKK